MRVPTLRTTARNFSIRTQTYQTNDSPVGYQFLVPQSYTASTRQLTSQTDYSPSHLDSVPIRLPYLGISIHAWRKRSLVSYNHSVVTHYFSYSVHTKAYINQGLPCSRSGYNCNLVFFVRINIFFFTNHWFLDQFFLMEMSNGFIFF